jgi:hypothetical protein
LPDGRSASPPKPSTPWPPRQQRESSVAPTGSYTPQAREYAGWIIGSCIEPSETVGCHRDFVLSFRRASPFLRQSSPFGKPRTLYVTRLWRSLAHYIGAFATLLLVGTSMASRVEAGCGHIPERPTVGLDFLSVDLPWERQTPPSKPCSGPQCSNRPASPSAPAPKASHRAELWDLVAQLCFVPTRSPDALPEDSPGRPTRLIHAIFHPPRRSL